MKNLMRLLSIVLFAVFLSCVGHTGTAEAYPALQLDIEDGVYDPVTETVMATTDPFTLYAFGTPNGGWLTDTRLLSFDYALAVAVTPKTSTVDNYGSFEIDGTTYNVTSDMAYGTPPYPDISDLPSHGIYDTFFLEIDVDFIATDQVTPYNTMDDFGAGLLDESGSGMYFASFDIDVSLLDPEIGLHFDLYRVRSDGLIGFFAPFSHDAGGGGGPPVPEPATFLLVGSGMAALGFYRRRSGRK